jgi:hydrogenase maturation protease
MRSYDIKEPFLVLGLGNPLLCDDSVGLTVVDRAEIKLRALHTSTTFKKNYSGGIDLLYDITGYDKAIIVDSVITGKAEPGFCHEFSLNSIEGTTQDRLVYGHGINVATVFLIGEECGYPMPAETVIFAIESTDICTFSEQLTPALEKSVNKIIKKINGRLSKWVDEAQKNVNISHWRDPSEMALVKGIT